MVSRLLYLEPGQLSRAWPFFLIYVCIFAALTLAEGLSLALFVSRVGAAQLPICQAVAAACAMFSVGWYLSVSKSRRTETVFALLLAAPASLFLFIWWVARSGYDSPVLYGLMYLGREISFLLLLLHFGAFLQDYFTRAELNRVLPVVYAGGRLGGMAAGFALEFASQTIEATQLLLGSAGLLVFSLAAVQWLSRRATPTNEPLADPPLCNASSSSVETPGVLHLLKSSRLMLWISLSTAALFFCRAGLTLQCGMCFEREFSNEAEMTAFLGRYTQIALAVSLIAQLFIVSRAVSWFGLRGAHIVYASIIALAALGGLAGMPLGFAVFARFAEGELRYGFRNPVAQMTVNLFPKAVRTCARAWSMGFLIPASTLAASITFAILMKCDAIGAVAIITAMTGAAYVGASSTLGSYLEPGPTETKKPSVRPESAAATASTKPNATSLRIAVH